MKFGTHISSAGGVQNAPKNAALARCEVFQFFSRSPQGGKAPVLSQKIIKEFKTNCKKFKQAENYIHAPYYINLASAKNNVYYGSVSVLREELERGSLLDVKYMMTHLGSARELGKKEALKKVAEGIKKILENYHGSTEFLIEMSAGAGEIMGDTLEEVAEIIKKSEIRNQKSGQGNKKPEIGVCIDTAHAFASGYDLRDKKAVKKFLDDFDKKIGLKKLKLIHANDSVYELGSRKDRHAHLGEGKIGLAGFEVLVKEPRLKKVNLILETPTEEGALNDIKFLKKWRGK
ncbi:MAG: deoxyribonuclease IV [Patescibacteria group bacterium]|nr:deoxyribonuclease IV [Patescibacteria group bacterium]